MLRVIVVGLVLVAGTSVARPAHAATFSVEVTGPAWQADALATTLRHDLAGADLVLATESARADITVDVAFANTTITYVITRAGMPPVRGASALGAIDRREFVNVIVDGMHRLATARTEARAPEPALSLVALLVGGLAWGLFVALCLPLVCPPLVGLHRVEHRELVRVLGAWSSVAIQRTMLAAIVAAPLVGGVWVVQSTLALSDAIAWGVVLPIAGLVARGLWLVARGIVAHRLDRELVDGVPTVHDPWHAQVRGYLFGYLGRANLDVDTTVVERMRFLPGREDDAIHAYAGRVVIGRAILESALAPYGRPHDFAMPRVSTLHWTHWNSGLVMATEADQKVATREDRDPSRHATVDEGVHERIALGEPPTFGGVIEPVALDPRTFYRPGDDPSWLDWDPGDEFDGTDPGDKDFLFGVLVLALGALQRHEDATFTLWARRRFGTIATLLGRAVGPVHRFFAAQSAALADVHAALAGARHHVAQYHAWRLWRRDDLVTSRAYMPELEATSAAIERALEREPRERRRDDAEARLVRARLVALAPLLDAERPRARTRSRRLVVAFAMLAGLAVAAVLVVQAVLYHSTYEQRLDQQRRQHDG